MKKSLIILFILILSNCSAKNDSNLLLKDTAKKKKNNQELLNILDKSNDLMSLTFKEYVIYINEYNKKSKYPDLNDE